MSSYSNLVPVFVFRSLSGTLAASEEDKDPAWKRPREKEVSRGANQTLEPVILEGVRGGILRTVPLLCHVRRASSMQDPNTELPAAQLSSF